jgi:hypothetical protein
LAAIVAIVIGLWQFKKQLRNADKIAHANVKPILGINKSDYLNFKAVTLKNYGAGTVVITSIKFCRNNTQNHQRLVDLFQLPHNPIWDDFSIFPAGEQYVEAGQNMVLAKLTSRGLARNNEALQPNQIAEILEAWSNQLQEITILVKYCDVLREEQPDCVRTFNE